MKKRKRKKKHYDDSQSSSSEEKENKLKNYKKKEKKTYNHKDNNKEIEKNSSEEDPSDSQSNNDKKKYSKPKKKKDSIIYKTPNDCFAAPLDISNLTPGLKNPDDQLYYSGKISLIGEYLKVFLKFGSFFPEFLKNENSKLIKKFIDKYSLFFNIKRFSIPCFGSISCGKSTFLNYLLKLHKILETNDISQLNLFVL